MRILEVDEYATSTLRAEAMRFVLQSEEMVFQFLFALTPYYIFAFGIDQEVAYILASMAVSLDRVFVRQSIHVCGVSKCRNIVCTYRSWCRLSSCNR